LPGLRLNQTDSAVGYLAQQAPWMMRMSTLFRDGKKNPKKLASKFVVWGMVDFAAGHLVVRP